jgi:hypothetical protein
MPLKYSDNLVMQLSVIIHRCKTLFQNLSDTEKMDLESTKLEVHDIETMLCNYMKDMISSPITGRLFLPSPSAYVDEATRVASLRRQLGSTE